MNKELLEKLQNEAKQIQDKVDKLRDIERLMADMNMDSGYNLNGRLEDIGFDLNQALNIINEGPDTVSRDVYTAANFSVTSDMAKKSYVVSSIATLYIDCMSNLMSIEDQVNAGTLSHYDAMKQLKAIVQTISPYSANVKNINNPNLTDMASSFSTLVKDTYAKYKQNLSPEQFHEITNAKVESTPIKTDATLEAVLDENDKLQKQTLDMKESSTADSKFDSVATDVLEKFKILNTALEVESYGGSINFDPDEVMFALRGLQDSVFDLSEISNNHTTSSDTSYARYLNDMSVVFSEKTQKTRSALADFQTGAFESSIPQIRKLIQETKSQDEKSEILKKFTKSAAWYMHGALMVQGQSNSHVDAVLNDVNEIIKSANSIAVQHEQEAVEFERKQTAIVTAEMKRQINQTVIEQIENSAVGSTLSKKEIEAMAEEITEETMEDSSVQKATAAAIAEAVDSVQESAVKSAKEVVKDIVQDTVEETVQSVVEDIVTEQVAVVEEKKAAEQLKEKPAEQLNLLERIDIENTPVEKTKEEVTEDVKWSLVGSMVDSMLSDTERFKDIKPAVIESVSSTFKLIAFDEGRVIKMKDGSTKRLQTVLRDFYTTGIDTEKFVEQIYDPENAETKDIISNLEVTQKVFDSNSILKMAAEITATPIYENAVKRFMPDSSSTREFSCEKDYYGKIDELQHGLGQDLFDNMTSESGLYNTIDQMYEQIHSKMSTLQESMFGQDSVSIESTTIADLTEDIISTDIDPVALENSVMGNILTDIDDVVLNTLGEDNIPTSTEPTQPTVPNLDSTIVSTARPLDKYKELLEKYDIQFITDSNFPEGKFVAIDRKTGQSPEYTSREQMDNLIRDLSFAKSWVSACGTGLSKTGGQNEYGIDPRQWEYSFNDGAQETFDWIVVALKNNSGPNLKQKIIDYITQNSNYKYADTIVESLLRDRNNKELLNSIHSVLLSEAGISFDKTQESTELELN